MDRIERLIEQGKAADAVDVARKWLDRNEEDRRAATVRSLLDKASWRVVSEDATLPALKAYRAEFPSSEHEPAARSLESSLAYYAALKDGSESAFRSVIDTYAGTPAATDALGKAADAGFTAASAAGTAEQWSLWLSRYPNAPQTTQAAEALHAMLWAEAEAAATAEGWLRLRAAFPDHPRADEAREREATLSMEGVSGEEDLLSLAGRYKGTVAGRSALRRAVFQGEILTLSAGPRPLGRDGEGKVVSTLTESRATVGKLMQSRTALAPDTLAVWLAPGHPFPPKVIPEWMRTGLEPATVASEWMRPAPGDIPLGPGAAIDASVHALGLRAEGFGDLEVSVTIEPRAPSPAASPLPAWCDGSAAEPTRALLREWALCGEVLVSGAPGGYWVTTEAALTSAGASVGAGELTWGTGCAAPGPISGEGASDLASGDDDDSAAPAGPQPQWLPAGTIQRSESRDLDGDGLPEGLHVIDSDGQRLVAVVDGRELTARVFEIDAEAATDELLAGVVHDGCAFKLTSMKQGGEAVAPEPALE